MPKTKEQKKEILKDIKDKIDKAKSVIFTNFNGLEAKENEELRKKLRKEDGEYYVAKKTLLDIAFRDLKIDQLKIKDFAGKVAAVFGYNDEVTPARIINDFRKSHSLKKESGEEKINFIGGVLEGRFISADTVNELAELPSKKELLAKVVGSINSPISGLVNSLAGNLRNLVYVLKAIEEKGN